MGQLLENDWVPLFEAASLAYLELTGVEGRVGSEENLQDVVELAVIALLRVAPIREGRESAAFDGIYIRRSDLRGAIAGLRNAH